MAYRVGAPGADGPEKGIEQVVFDRNGYLYHGASPRWPQGARDGGLEF